MLVEFEDESNLPNQAMRLAIQFLLRQSIFVVSKKLKKASVTLRTVARDFFLILNRAMTNDMPDNTGTDSRCRASGVRHDARF